ncbi:DUF3341 domain-containing protein [Candidatus Amoebophilus asiaticus]|nr:DUF3341 domain-containing protein [Candidatus Amoebophilus asiaticus]
MMSKSKFILGLFDDEQILLKAIKNVRDMGISIHECYTPFPVHGIEDAMGMKYTRIPIAAFLIGGTFCLAAFCFMWWVSAVDFPINFGGKPFSAFPSFIPPTFEATVLSTAVGMAVILFTTCWLVPQPNKHPLDLRITDDRFVMAFLVDDKTDVKKINEVLKDNGTVEIKEIEVTMDKSLEKYV